MSSPPVQLSLASSGAASQMMIDETSRTARSRRTHRTGLICAGGCSVHSFAALQDAAAASTAANGRVVSVAGEHFGRDIGFFSGNR